MTEQTHTGLTIESRPVGDGDFYDFGVWVEGAFVGLHRVKATWLENEIALAKEAAANALPPEPAPTTTQ